MKAKGFTLIEVLIAVAILGIGLLAVMQATQRSVNNMGYLRQKTQAMLVAEYTLARATTHLISIPSLGSTQHGNTDMFNQTWHWRLTLRSTGIDNVRELYVSVSDSEEKIQYANLSDYIAQDAQGKLVLWR